MEDLSLATPRLWEFLLSFLPVRRRIVQRATTVTKTKPTSYVIQYISHTRRCESSAIALWKIGQPRSAARSFNVP
jgi:hypothetical protein